MQSTAQAIQIRMNEAMKVERTDELNFAPHECGTLVVRTQTAQSKDAQQSALARPSCKSVERMTYDSVFQR